MGVQLSGLQMVGYIINTPMICQVYGKCYLTFIYGIPGNLVTRIIKMSFLPNIDYRV